MLTVGGMIEEISSFANLLAAARQARRGKSARPDVARFHVDLEPNLLSLRDDLRSGVYQPGKHRVFAIRDPKPRLISAAPYRDRVAHHAICRVIEPVLDRGLIYDCYANRIGKGTHRALDRCTRFARQYAYVLKCDVAQYFPSMDRAILKGRLRRSIRCRATLALLDRIVDDAAPSRTEPAYFPGDDLFGPYERPRGTPIGNLASQLFGNIFLSGFDHWVTELLRAPAYIRFVDDFLVFSDDRRWLADALAQIREEMARLRLELHPRKCQVQPVRCGVAFLGWQVFPDHRRIRRATGVRFQRRLTELATLYGQGAITLEQVRAPLASWLGHLRYGDTYGLRAALLGKAAFVRGGGGNG